MGRMDIRKKMEARKLAAATIISHKQKKKLEKIVQKKKLKSTRTNLIKDLKKYQLKPEQQQLLHSTSFMQTRGLKRFTQDHTDADQNNSAAELHRRQEELGDIRLDAASLYKRKKRKGTRETIIDKQSSSDSEDTDQVSSDNDEENYHSSDTEIYNIEHKSLPVESIIENQVKSDPESHKLNGTLPILQKVGTTDSKQCKKTPASISVVTEDKPVKKAIYIEVFRDPEIEKSRSELPIIGEEQRIMETITYNQVVVISGETGSGKTTQLPQFLYEAGYALDGRLIGITEPRRVAAVSMCNRVAKELNLHDGQVSYQIRFSGDVSSKTKIKFMTDGILLKECQKDFLLSKYSAIIIDEAHERSIFSDILIGLLSRIVPLRDKKGDPLKLIIMSATLRVTDFTQNKFLYKKIPPVISIDARQYPVAIQFSRTTPSDYLEAAYKKVCRIHRRLPKGGVLVFVTSQQDVRVLCRKLRQRFPMNKTLTSKDEKATLSRIENIPDKAIDDKLAESPEESSHSEIENVNLSEDILINNYKVELIAEHEEDEEMSAENDDRCDGWNDDYTDNDEDDDSENEECQSQPLYCLGLFAMLPIEKQNLVFEDSPSDARFCVISTNVAETSLTIPNIRYVVDTGKEKTKVYDVTTGISKFVTTWTSKASAEQRKGRAGRTGPGHCFRLYSSAVFSNDFQEFAEPQVIKKPIEDLLLQMKSMNIDNVVNFPFPTRPPEEALVAAEKKLVLLGALNEKNRISTIKKLEKMEFCSRPTKLGKAMACFAIGARFAKMLVLAPRDLLPHVIAVVSALTVREMFLTDLEDFLDEDNQKKKRSKWHDSKRIWRGRSDNMRGLGDLMIILKALDESEKSGCSKEFCESHGLRNKSMLEIHKLRTQLTHEVNSVIKNSNIRMDQSLKISDAQAKVMRQLFVASFFDHVARRIPDGQRVRSEYVEDNQKTNDKTPETSKPLRNAYECLEVEDPVYISQESVLRAAKPEFIVYNEIYEGDKKMYMRNAIALDPAWLPEYGFKLCRFSDPPGELSLKTNYDPKRDMIICRKTCIFGQISWNLGPVDVPLQVVDSGKEIYKHFAMYLLNGQVIPWFEKHKPKLLSPASIMIKPWAKLQPRTEKLLQALIARDVKSKKQFLSILKIEPEYLKREYLLWIPESIHWTVKQDWEQLVNLAY